MYEFLLVKLVSCRKPIFYLYDVLYWRLFFKSCMVIVTWASNSWFQIREVFNYHITKQDFFLPSTHLFALGNTQNSSISLFDASPKMSKLSSFSLICLPSSWRYFRTVFNFNCFFFHLIWSIAEAFKHIFVWLIELFVSKISAWPFFFFLSRSLSLGYISWSYPVWFSKCLSIFFCLS